LRPAGTAVIAAGSAAGVAFLAWTLYSHERAKRARCVDFARSFYSSLRIEEESFPERSNAVFRSLVHGTTIHGGQWRDPEHQREPTSYYGRSSGVGRAIEGLRRRGEPLRVGVVGLGAGVLAAYCNPGDSFTFFEIDPLVERIATSRFSFLAGCGGREVVQGDARLSLARPRDGFGLLAVDAFSGDAIPVHLLTIEAFQTFAARLAPGGILAMHVSNRFVDLAPVVAASAARIGWSSFQVEENADEERGVYANTWVLVVADRARMADLALGGLSPLVPPAGFRAWTDDFSHLAGLLHDVRTSKDDDEEEGEE
jgi:hypothetical protein